jgi:hypothetical protein
VKTAEQHKEDSQKEIDAIKKRGKKEADSKEPKKEPLVLKVASELPIEEPLPSSSRQLKPADSTIHKLQTTVEKREESVEESITIRMPKPKKKSPDKPTLGQTVSPSLSTKVSIADYSPQSSDAIELRQGDALTVIEQKSRTWVVVRNERTGEQGYVPLAFIDERDNYERKLAEQLAAIEAQIQVEKCELFLILTNSHRLTDYSVKIGGCRASYYLAARRHIGACGRYGRVCVHGHRTAVPGSALAA